MRRPPGSEPPQRKCEFYLQVVFADRYPFAICPEDGTERVDETIPALWMCPEHVKEYRKRQQGTLMRFGPEG